MGKLRHVANAASVSLCASKRLLSDWAMFSLIIGTFLNSLVGGMVNLLLSIHVYRLTGSSPIAVSLLFVITYLPNFLVAPVSSGLADRYNRRKFLGICGLLRACLCCLLLLNSNLATMLALSFAITSVGALMKPARYALAAQLTRGADRAVMNSLLNLVITSAGILGAALTGLLTAVAGGIAFTLAAVVSLVAALFDSARARQLPRVEFDSQKNGPTEQTRRVQFWHSSKLKQAVLLIWQQPLLRGLTVVSTLLWFGLGMQEPLLLVFTNKTLQGSDATYAYLSAVGSVGALFGAALAAPLAAELPRALVSFAISLIAAGSVFVVFAANRQLPMAFLLFAVFNACYGVANVIDDLLEQELSPDFLRARVIAVVGAIATGGYLIGGGVIGLLAQWIGPAWAAEMSAVAIVASGLVALLTMRPRGRRVVDS